MRPIALEAPRDLETALRLLAADPGTHPFAGGTDLMVLLESGKLPPGRYVNLWGLGELRGIVVARDHVSLGALTTYTDVLSDPLLQSEYPLLCSAARQTGGVATQNRGTLGGNIANASPAADSPPALLVYDAELELRSTRGVRRVPYARFHTGYKTMDLVAGEIISRILLPRRQSTWRHSCLVRECPRLHVMPPGVGPSRRRPGRFDRKIPGAMAASPMLGCGVP